MTTIFPIALSGLAAQGKKAAVAAGNIANATTSGPVPSAQNGGKSTVYKPLQVNMTALSAEAGGGVMASVTERANGISQAYAPESSDANAAGMIAVPNIDLANEIIDLKMAETMFKANIKALKTQDDMLGELLDTLS